MYLAVKLAFMLEVISLRDCVSQYPLRNPLESGSRLALFFGISKTGRREEVGGFGQSFTQQAITQVWCFAHLAVSPSVVTYGVEKAAMPLNKP